MNGQRRIGHIADGDATWIAEQMQLRDMDEARSSFLLSGSSADISACPGSGKTTLVVAKLAILAKNWDSRTRGILVLSHTNVAREEIQRRLGKTNIGERLFRYPHFIDTIHGFVNRYLALPWLLSNGHQVTAIDDDLTARVRRRVIGSDYWSVKPFLDPRRLDLGQLNLTSADFSNPLANWGVSLSRSSPTFQKLSTALQQTAELGYFKFNEMFLFAEALLDAHPEVADTLRRRFPFVLIDEMQDTSAQQSAILDKLFPGDSEDVVVQRVGDINQAIFEEESSEGGRFPDSSRQRIDVCDSFRFDHSIASLFSNFAVQPVLPDGLRGIGQSHAHLPDNRHTVFVFPDGDTSNVLPAYARLVLRTLTPSDVEENKVAAVGAVHQPKPEVAQGDPKFPATVSHYWEGYTPGAGQKMHQPHYLIEVFRAAQRHVATGDASGTVASALDKVAVGLARLVNMCNLEPVFRLRSRPHHSMEQRLAEAVGARDIYRSVITEIVLSEKVLARDVWEPTCIELRNFVLACSSSADLNAAADYLEWKEPAHRPDDVDAPANTFLATAEFDQVVLVDISSIHAVKGETHAATLVLETFQNAHFFKSLMPWLLGDRTDANGCNPLQKRRLRSAYVAMSRPAQLLCLAMPRSSVGGDGQRYAENIAKLQKRGWSIEEL